MKATLFDFTAAVARAHAAKVLQPQLEDSGDEEAARACHDFLAELIRVENVSSFTDDWDALAECFTTLQGSIPRLWRAMEIAELRLKQMRGTAV